MFGGDGVKFGQLLQFWGLFWSSDSPLWISQAAKVAKEQASRPPGINHYHTGFLLLIQIGLCIIWGLTVQQDKFPKQPIPRAGLLENPDRIDQVPSFKRYPPGYDIFTGSERINQYKVQEVKKEVRMHLFALRTVER